MAKKLWLNSNGELLLHPDGKLMYSEECCCCDNFCTAFVNDTAPDAITIDAKAFYDAPGDIYVNADRTNIGPGPAYQLTILPGGNPVDIFDPDLVGMTARDADIFNPSPYNGSTLKLAALPGADVSTSLELTRNCDIPCEFTGSTPVSLNWSLNGLNTEYGNPTLHVKAIFQPDSANWKVVISSYITLTSFVSEGTAEVKGFSSLFFRDNASNTNAPVGGPPVHIFESAPRQISSPNVAELAWEHTNAGSFADQTVFKKIDGITDYFDGVTVKGQGQARDNLVNPFLSYDGTGGGGSGDLVIKKTTKFANTGNVLGVDYEVDVADASPTYGASIYGGRGMSVARLGTGGGPNFECDYEMDHGPPDWKNYSYDDMLWETDQCKIDKIIVKMNVV